MKVAKQHKRKNLIPDLLSSACNMFDNPAYHKRMENQIPVKFFKEFRLFGKFPIRNLSKHLAYAGAIFTAKELLLVYEPNISLDTIGMANEKKFSLQIVHWEIDTDVFTPTDSMSVANQYIFESEFDRTAEMMFPAAYCFNIYSIMMDIWNAGYLNDQFFFDLITRGLSRYAVNPLKKETELVFGVSQWAAMVILTDFIRQIAASDFDCADKAKQAMALIKKNSPMDFCNSPIIKTMTKKKLFEFLELVRSEPYSCSKHKSDDTLFRLKPYLGEQSRRLLELAEQDILFYEPAIRQIYFGTQTFTTNSINMYEQCMFIAKAIEAGEKGMTRLDAELDAKKIAEKGYISEIKTLKSTLRKKNKEIQSLEKTVAKDSSEEIECLQKKNDALAEELSRKQKEIQENQSELNTCRTKYIRYKTRIETLTQQTESLKKQNASMGEELKEKDEVIKSLTEDYASMFPNNNTQPDISDEDIEIAKLCKYVFFIPSFANSLIPIIQNYFPNSKVIRSQENDTFNIGTSTDGVIMCTMGIKHGTYWRLRTQCESLNIGIAYVNSCGLKSFFTCAVEKYKKDKLHETE